MNEPKKKLIEVALPLEAINQASAREKSIRHGHPSTLHLWWARRPLATCRAVLFASLVDDPSSHPEEFPTEDAQEKERQRLFRIIEELVTWENSNNEEVLARAKQEIMKSTGGNPPPVLDPFCGGGSIPLEAQRLGLEAHGSDLNPVAVLITKAMIEIPPQFADMPPVNPEFRNRIGMQWKGAEGLADDVRYYGKWMRDEAEKRIGHLYPKIKLPKEYGCGEATVIAWLWARTVKCPNPACHAIMPLVHSFWLSTKKGKEAWVEPVIDNNKNETKFLIKYGEPDPIESVKIGSGTGYINKKGSKTKATFQCIYCKNGIVKGNYIDNEANYGRMGVMPLAVVAKGASGRIFLPFDDYQRDTALITAKKVFQENKLYDKVPTEQARGTFASNAQGRSYGFKNFSDYFTTRQLVTISTFIDLITEFKEFIYRDSLSNGLNENSAKKYAIAVATYLSFAIDRTIDYCSSLCTWSTSRETMRNTFARQGIAMTWDFAEVNPFSQSTGNINGAIDWIIKIIGNLNFDLAGKASQQNATKLYLDDLHPMISTDPPYYDNIVYSDLSDFFYVWLRRAMVDIYPDLFNTVLVPKADELIASPYRFDGNKENAKAFFENGLEETFVNIRHFANQAFPLTVYYAFKQSERNDDNNDDATSMFSTGWETMLNGLINAGFSINGTWPMRSELVNRPVANGTNALASSIVLVCRPRLDTADQTTRRDFIKILHNELPPAIHTLQQGNIAPVDLAQAAIGPGMAIYSRYSQVLEADGTPMSVRIALQLINQELDAFHAAQEGDLDADTRFCIAWFEQFGMNEGVFGEADVLARAKNTAVARLENSGLLTSSKGKVRLRKRSELDINLKGSNSNESVWGCTQQLVRALDDGGEQQAALVDRRIGGELSQAAKSLAYRLYLISDRKGWTEEALAYNTLVVSWSAIQVKMADLATVNRAQQELF